MIELLKKISNLIVATDEQDENNVNESLAIEHDMILTEIYDLVEDKLGEYRKQLV